MRCADCPDFGETGTRKRAVCCHRTGELARRARAEADILDRLLSSAPRRSVRTVALVGSLLGSEISGAFHPSTWGGGRFAAPLTAEERESQNR